MLDLQDLELEPLMRLSRDLKRANLTLGAKEVRFLVDLYYAIQDDRKRADNQQAALSKGGEPSEIFRWIFSNMGTLEGDIKKCLDPWSLSRRDGRWLRSIVGIGPVIASGLLAHIDIAKTWTDENGLEHVGLQTAGHIWRYAGLDPTVTWNKGQKRPWNADLKVLCWKAGQSFMKFQNHENDIYGKVYVARKSYEIARNESGANAETAALALKNKKYRVDTTAFAEYSKGKLPAAQIDARARRYAVKLFLSHLHHVMYECHFGEAPPKPYVIAILGHADFIGPPNWPID